MAGCCTPWRAAVRRTRATMSDVTSGRPPLRERRAVVGLACFAVLACMAVSLLLAGHTRRGAVQAGAVHLAGHTRRGAVQAGAVHTPRHRPIPLARRHAAPRVGRRTAPPLA